MLTIRTLGTPQILCDGVPVALPFKRAEALLYYLAVERSATRQELIALLWESDDETKGRKNLRHALYTLRKELGGDVLVSPQKSMVVLNAQWEVDCDYDRFVRQGEIDAYGGSFLAGFGVRNAFALEEWILRTRENLHSRYLSRLEKQARTLREAGNVEQACEAAKIYLGEEPFDEAMAVFLMDCYLERRQYTRAAQVYQKLKEQLSQELGVDPLESTTLQYYDILNQWNDAAKQPDERADHAVPVGREKIYSTLRAAALAFAETATRRSSQLLVGESGSGKSEVINHFLRVGEFRDLLVVRTECLQSEQGLALSAWRQIVRQILEFARQNEIQIPKALPDRMSGETVLDRALEDMLALFLIQVSRERKILLILEDLQWADTGSVELLQTLLRRLERGTLMAVASMTWGCSQQIQVILDGLEADGLLHRQVLRPLSREDTGELLRRELGDGAAQQLGDWFYQESGGNLRLLTSLAEAYDRTGNVQSTLESMDEILLKRLSGLSEDALRVTQLLSLSTQGISVKVLRELVGMEKRQLSEILLTLRSRAIAEEFAEGEENGCRFLHPKLRQLAYDHLTAYQRQELHGQMAAFLAARETNPSESLCREIAWHYDLAGQLEASVDFELKALEQQTRWRCQRFVPWEKAGESESLETAVDRSRERLMKLQHQGKGKTADFSRRLDLICGRIALFQGEWERASALLGEMTAVGVEGSRLELAKTCVLLADSAYYRQAIELAERYVSAGLRFLEWERDDLTLARLYQLRGSCFGLRGDYDRGRYYFQEALDLLEKLPQSPQVRCLLASVYGDLARNAQCRNDYAHAGPWYKKALGLLKDMDCVGQVWLLADYGRMAFALDDYIRARDLFRQAYAMARKTGELWGRAAAGAYCAYFAMAEGDAESAAVLLREAIEQAQIMQSPLEWGIVNFVCMRIRRRLDLEQLRDSPLMPLLPDPADDYARRGVRQCSFLPNVFEVQILAKDLRDGISSQLRYRSSELYSKNKRFMSE